MADAGKPMRTQWMRAAGAVVLAAAPARAVIGLGARFGDVILENAQPGTTYDLREVAHVPFGVENRGDADADVAVRFEQPAAQGLAKDYEAVPDPGWFKAVPTKIRIGAHAIGYFDLLLSIPNDPALKGKHYQATVTAAMVGDAMLNVGIQNRIRFSIGAGPQSLREEKKKKAMQQLDFDVTPSEIYLRDVPVGKTYDARKEARKSIRVANYASDALSVQMTVAGWDRDYVIPEGYESIPDPKWIAVQQPQMKIDGEAIGVTSVTLDIPDDPKWKGRKFAAMVKSGLTTGFWLDAPVKLFVETAR